jgi:hypothetical protein
VKAVIFVAPAESPSFGIRAGFALGYLVFVPSGSPMPVV